MSSNVGLTTPRGSGTSGYVQRNLSVLRPRDSGYGSTASPRDFGNDAGFKQRQPDKQILEHDRRRAIEVRVFEERDRLEEENEAIDEEYEKEKEKEKEKDKKDGKKESESGPGSGSDKDGAGEDKPRKVKLSDEEIEERVDKLRAELTEELEDELSGRGPAQNGYGNGKRKQDDGEQGSGHKGRKQFKAYQVHERAEAKIHESERLRKALGIRNEGEDGPRRNDSGRGWDDRRQRDRRDDGSYRSSYNDRDARW